MIRPFIVALILSLFLLPKLEAQTHTTVTVEDTQNITGVKTFQNVTLVTGSTTGAWSFNGVLTSSGGSLTGSWSGNPSFTGSPTFTSAPTISGTLTSSGGGITGSWSGSPTFTGSPTISGILTSSGGSLTGSWAGSPTYTGSPTFSGGGSLTGSWTGNPTISGLWTWSNAGIPASPFITTSSSSGALPASGAGSSPMNQAHTCGSSTTFVTTIGLPTTQNQFPCTVDSLYLGANQVGGGFAAATHINLFNAKAGQDTASGGGEASYCTSANNSGNFPNDNNTNNTCEVVNAATPNGASGNAIAFDGVAQLGTLSSTTQSRTGQASQLLTSAGRVPGWFGALSGDYSSIETYVVQSGSQDLTLRTGGDSSDSTHNYLFGDYVAGAYQVGHAKLRGSNGVKSQVGDWCAASVITCYYVGGLPIYPTNATNAATVNDIPAWGSTFGPRAVISGQSNIEQFLSTTAGTACTLTTETSAFAVVTGYVTSTAGESVLLATYTCNAAHGFTNDIYHPIHITGASVTQYNIDCFPITMAATTFTCAMQATEPNGTVAAAGFTLTSNVVTLTMSSNPATAGFSTSQPIIVGGFSGADAFVNGTYTPTSVTATQIQFSLTHTNYSTSCVTSGATQATPLCGTVVAEGWASATGGTATQTVEQSLTSYLDGSNPPSHHWGWASPPNPASPNGTDVMRLLPTLNSLLMATGSATNPSYSFNSGTNSGWYNSTTNIILANAGSNMVLYGTNIERRGSGRIVGWSSNADPTLAVSDVSLTRSAANVVQVNSGESAGSGGGIKAAEFIAGGAAATITGTGACATTSGQSGGRSAGQITCTGTTGASTLTITTGFTATNGWSCWASDITHTLAGSQSTASATAPVMTFTSVTANDVITFGCMAY